MWKKCRFQFVWIDRYKFDPTSITFQTCPNVTKTKQKGGICSSATQCCATPASPPHCECPKMSSGGRVKTGLLFLQQGITAQFWAKTTLEWVTAWKTQRWEHHYIKYEFYLFKYLPYNLTYVTSTDELHDFPQATSSRLFWQLPFF